MRKHLVMTLVGPDQTGIVDQVTKRVLEYDGNVEESRMVRLGGEFAMLLLISVPARQIKKITLALSDLEHGGFQVFTRQTDPEKTTPYDGWLSYRVTVSGADYEGIIHSITHFLAEQRINVEIMDTNTAAAPMSGTFLFTMTAIIVVPPELTYHSWRDRLDEMSDTMNVHIEVSSYTGAPIVHEDEGFTLHDSTSN